MNAPITMWEHSRIHALTGHTRIILRAYARNNDLISSTMPMSERNDIITKMIDNWSNTCTNLLIPPKRKQSSLLTPCGVGLTISNTNRLFSALSKAMFDLNSNPPQWLCTNCYYKRYPKFKSSGWTSKLPAPRIQSARTIFEKTGKRYNDENRYKHQPLPIFDKSKANHLLTREFIRGWVKYRCPQPGCDFYLCARAFQGWPEHTCIPINTTAE